MSGVRDLVGNPLSHSGNFPGGTSFKRYLTVPTNTTEEPEIPNDPDVVDKQLGPLDMDAVLVNLQLTSDQMTTAGHSLAVDNDGDFVVTWTGYDEFIDENGETVVDANIYARFFTDEVQRITLPHDIAVDHDDLEGTVGKFDLEYNTSEIQQISITAGIGPFVEPLSVPNLITGSFSLAVDVNGDGEIHAGEAANVRFDESDLIGNQRRLRDAIRSIKVNGERAFPEVTVRAINPRDYTIDFGQPGVDQPQLRVLPGTVNFETAFLPAVEIFTLRETFTVPGIRVSTEDPWQTAAAIESFFREINTVSLGPVDFPPPDRIDPTSTEAPYSSPWWMQSYAPQVSVVPVAGPSGMPSLTTFDVTFTGSSGKVDHPDLVVKNPRTDVKDSNGDPIQLFPSQLLIVDTTSHAGQQLSGAFKLRVDGDLTKDIAFDTNNVAATTGAIATVLANEGYTGTTVTLRSDLPAGVYGFEINFERNGMPINAMPLEYVPNAAMPLNVPVYVEAMGSKTLKEPSATFRVNPTEADDPLTEGLDVYDQTHPSVGMDADGDFVIAWQSEIPNSATYGSIMDVFARRFTSFGHVDSSVPVPGEIFATDPQIILNADHGLSTGTFRLTVDGQQTGDIIFNNAQKLTFKEQGGGASKGLFRLNVNGEMTADIEFDAHDLTTVRSQIQRELDKFGYDGIIVTTTNASQLPSGTYQFNITFDGETGSVPIKYVAAKADPLDVEVSITGMHNVIEDQLRSIGLYGVQVMPAFGSSPYEYRFDVNLGGSNAYVDQTEIGYVENSNSSLRLDAEFSTKHVSTGVRTLTSPAAEDDQRITFRGQPGQTLNGNFKLRISEIGSDALPITTDSIHFNSNDLLMTAGNIETALTEADFDGVVVTRTTTLPNYWYRFNIRFGGASSGIDYLVEYVEDTVTPVNLSASAVSVKEMDVDFYSFLVNVDTANPQFDPAVDMDDQGNFVIAWANGGQELSYFNHIAVQRFDRDGQRLGNAFQVNAETTSIQFAPYVALSPANDFVITWSKTDDPMYAIGAAAPVNSTVLAAVFAPDGTPMWAEFPVGGGGASAAVFDSNYNFIITWE
ncbi:MAG TPA: hypothetical protein VE890_06265, partial [Thermoguttaceae bacterium]|nr:hypothetical protein [Thermoguttaceae bacterium]